MQVSKRSLERKSRVLESTGAKAFHIVVVLVFLAAASFELALLLYAPKSQPLQFHRTLVLPYVPLLVGWTIATVLAGIALVKVRDLYAFFRRFAIVRRHWGNMLVALVATVFSIVLVETGLRVADPLGISSFPITLTFWQQTMLPDPVLRYRLRPNASAVYHGTPFETNSVGMRDDEALKNVPGRRIVMLGDSVTLGLQIPFEDIMPTRLERLLGGRETVDVINTSVSSYNTVQQSILLEQIGDDYEPDLVLLVYVENDTETEHTLPFYPAEYWQQPVYWPRNVMQKSYIRHPLRLGLSALRSGSDAPTATLVEQEGWRLSRAALARMNEWCRGRDIPFVVVFYAMLEPSVSQAYLELLEETGEELGFPVIDSAGFWEDRPASDVHLSFVDSHLNKLGHGLMAAGVSAELQRRYPALFDTGPLED